jgi:hypothetical protein
MRRWCICAALVLGSTACARSPSPPPPPPLHAVAVFPPNNRTGNELVVAGGTLLEKYAFHTERVTVGDVLAAEARRLLDADGIAVVAPDVVDAAVADYRPQTPETAARQAGRAHIDAAVLFIEIRRWEPDAPFNPSSIIVALAATLIDPADGHVVWSSELRTRPVATPGTVAPGAADIVAATKAIQELLAPFAPATASSIQP